MLETRILTLEIADDKLTHLKPRYVLLYGLGKLYIKPREYLREFKTLLSCNKRKYKRQISVFMLSLELLW